AADRISRESARGGDALRRALAGDRRGGGAPSARGRGRSLPRGAEARGRVRRALRGAPLLPPREGRDAVRRRPAPVLPPLRDARGRPAPPRGVPRALRAGGSRPGEVPPGYLTPSTRKRSTSVSS